MLLLFLEQQGLRVTTSTVAYLPDPDDAAFLEVAATCGAILITGNARHYPPDRRLGVKILEPRAFLDAWMTPLC